MSDLISRQAAIEALEAKKDKSAKGDMGCFYNTIIQNDIDALKGLPSELPKPQWIPCNWHTEKENLPQECKSVLICMKDSYGYRIGVSYRADYNRWKGFGRVNVIAWMPLPTPYREE